MASLFRRLVNLIRKPKAKKPLTPAEQRKITIAQIELAKRLGNIPGVKIPGITPQEAERLHREEQQRGRSRRVQRGVAKRVRQLPASERPLAPIESIGATWTQWYPMNSTNVDRIRYLESARLCQAVYKKNKSLYQYDGVEPEIFLGWLQTHSPGQYQHYVIRAYGYRYTKLASGQEVSPPRENRFEGEPFAVPESIEAFQRSRGRASVDIAPTAVGFAPPPTDAWKQYRPAR